MLDASIFGVELCMATNLFNGKIDLGNTPEMFAAFAHFGTLSPGLEYGMLHGSLHAVLAESDSIPAADLGQVSEQAAAFRKEFGDKLSAQEMWILKQLESSGKLAGG